jgi:3-dehydroquinate synthase
MESSFNWNSKTKVEFLKKLPSRERLIESLGFKPEKFLVVYDKRLAKNEAVSKWLKDFVLPYPVAAGESLKDMYTFSGHLNKIMKIITPFSNKSLCVIGLGGGSVGDFTGFLASVLKRGVPLIHIPTTLLAAMDSAHGGKTGLNVASVKNQVGTFYPADSVLLVKSLFEGLPKLQLQSAGGELAKMAILEGGKLYERFKESFEPTLESIWEFLPEAIEAKYKVVDKDPFEKSGERQILNLGHSLGHALESYYGLAHGVAVGQGLIFAIQWSEHQGYFRGANPEEILKLLTEKLDFQRPREFAKAHRSMSRSKLERYVSEDKKLTDTRHLHFIFLEDVGRPFRKVVTLESFLTETQRQGWTAV